MRDGGLCAFWLSGILAEAVIGWLFVWSLVGAVLSARTIAVSERKRP